MSSELELGHGGRLLERVDIEVALGGGQRSVTELLLDELEVFGSHGMQAFRYTEMMAMIEQGKLEPGKLLGETITLDDSLEALVNMDQFTSTGVTVINRFS